MPPEEVVGRDAPRALLAPRGGARRRRPSSPARRHLRSRAAARRASSPSQSVTAWYGRQEILHDIDITLRARECLALVGESGSGKTTLARCIAGLHPFKIEGDIDFQGKPLPRLARSRPRQLRHAIQYVFQNPYSSLNPRKTIAQILSQPLSIFFDYTARSAARSVWPRCSTSSRSTSTLLGRYPDQLSGGERQRVAIARALAAEPDRARLRRGHVVARRLRAGLHRRAAGAAAAARSVCACCS